MDEKKRQEKREYHKRWRDNTDREKFLAGQRRRHRKWYYTHLEEARNRSRITSAKKRASDPEASRKYIAEQWRKHADRNRRFVLAYKTSLGCVDCGEQDPVVLDFDHVRGRKIGRVSSMRAQGWSLLTIVREIEKCELRCANCHRRRHNTGENRR